MTQPSKKLILISVFHSLISKNILNTGIVTGLQKLGFEIALLVPTHKEEYFCREFPGHLVIPYNTKRTTATRRERVLHQLSMLLLDSHYLHYKRIEILQTDISPLKYFKHLVRESIVYLFSNRSWTRRVNQILNKLICSTNGLDKILKETKPDLVFVTDVFNQADGHLLHAANKLSISNIAMVRSWDNCLSKGTLRFTADQFITNNEVLKSELIKLHGVPEAKITPVGWPQFDSFVNQKAGSRDAFFKEHNLNPNKKLVVFAPAGAILSDTDDDICKVMLSGLKKKRLPNNVQFYVRNHPHHPAKFSDIVERGMVVQTPGEKLVNNNDKETEMDRKELDFLKNLMAHTDVLVWVATSLCLDALVFDVPEVVVNFDGYKTKDYYSSVKRYHDEAHMKKIFKSKPFKVANNPEELLEYLSDYINDSTIDSLAREELRKVQLYKVDGQSGQRVVDVIKGVFT